MNFLKGCGVAWGKGTCFPTVSCLVLNVRNTSALSVTPFLLSARRYARQELTYKPQISKNGMPMVIRNSWRKLSLFLFSYRAQAEENKTKNKQKIKSSLQLVLAKEQTLKILVITWPSMSCLMLRIQLQFFRSRRLQILSLSLSWRFSLCPRARTPLLCLPSHLTTMFTTLLENTFPFF